MKKKKYIDTNMNNSDSYESLPSSPEIEFVENIYLTIIGCSGRNEKISLETFEKAKQDIKEFIKKQPNDINDIILQSGGSSGIDHLAIVLFLEGIDGKQFAGLRICLPCQFDQNLKKFSFQNKYEQQAAKMLNELHTNFSKNIKRSSFDDIKFLYGKSNVTIEHGLGFYSRNRMLAEYANTPFAITIAMTFSKGNVPNDGGTKYTWDLIKGNKFHIKLIS